MCGPQTQNLANFCNPGFNDEWIDGWNTAIKDVSGTILQKLKENGLA
jgi:hypothetical protein